MINTKDHFYLERWEKQFSKIKKPDPICCNKEMEWHKSDKVGYYYRCTICKKNIKRNYYHEFFIDKKGNTQLRKKTISLEKFL